MKNEIVKVGILSEFWEHQKKDVIDIVLPIIKSAISSNYSTMGKHKVIDLNSTLNELKENYNDNFTMLLLRNALNRLENYKVLTKHDDVFCVDNEEEILNSKKYEERVSIKVGEEWTAIIDDLKTYVCSEVIIPFFKNINIENNFWDFLNKDIDLINNVDINEKANRFFAQYITIKKNNNEPIYKYIKRIILAIFISKAINLYDVSVNNYWENKKIIVDTRVLMNLLKMNFIEDNNATKELYDILKRKNNSFKTFEHNMDEVRKVIGAYQYQRKNGKYYNTNINLFERENYSDSHISLFSKTLVNQVESLDISIIDADSIEGKDNRYNQDFDNNYNNKDNCTSMEYDKMNYCKTMQMFETDEDIIFLSTGKGLANLYSKVYGKSNKFVFISEDDLACLCFINNSHCLSNYSINRVLSSAYLMQEPTEKYFDSLMDNLEKLAVIGDISEEIKLAYIQDANMQKELYLKTNYVGLDISKDNMIEAYDEHVKRIQKPLEDKIKETEENYENRINELKDDIEYKENKINSLIESNEINIEKNEQLNKENIELKKYKELWHKNVEKKEKLISRVSQIVSIIFCALIICVLGFILYVWCREPFEIVKNIKKSIIYKIIVYLINVFLATLIITALLTVKKIYKKLYRGINKFINKLFENFEKNN